MYLHKENRELFHDAILLTSQKLEVSEDIVEKDYYVTWIFATMGCHTPIKQGQCMTGLMKVCWSS